ncbi:hypothetical protein QA640_11875 [Bradyrhizobium sp. CB82]|uniref:hypothetical protein n=1 Tax=Bradyrhizobium sp. CB82 TaxID=3039159 RepID=UPI0024B0E9FC|nr:hypothetical protein [Bradyrhizobium sp. CB82]WFU43079.1 hypothetical protein QA640_11875 [Bradyrhizobium sp. CB82]
MKSQSTPRLARRAMTHALEIARVPPAVVDVWKLDHTKNDSADKSHCEVRGNNAQSADERHRAAPSVCASLRATDKVNSESVSEKVSLAVARPPRPPPRVARMVKET